MKWLWIAAAALFAVAAVAMWVRIGDPTFVVGLFTAAAGSFAAAVWPGILSIVAGILNAKGSDEERRKVREGDSGRDERR